MHGRRTQNNTVQCAGAGAGREYPLRMYVLVDLRLYIQIRKTPSYVQRPVRRLTPGMQPGPDRDFMCLPARVNKTGYIESRGKVLELSDKLNLTRPLTAREKNRPVI